MTVFFSLNLTGLPESLSVYFTGKYFQYLNFSYFKRRRRQFVSFLSFMLIFSGYKDFFSPLLFIFLVVLFFCSVHERRSFVLFYFIFFCFSFVIFHFILASLSPSWTLFLRLVLFPFSVFKYFLHENKLQLYMEGQKLAENSRN